MYILIANILIVFLYLFTRTLLKRIGTVLTGPPKITDKMYQDMKKLCQSKLNSKKELYEKAIVEENNRRFFEYLKKVPGVYNAKDWERDYRKQVCYISISLMHIINLLIRNFK